MMRELLERLELLEHPEVVPGVNRVVSIDAYMRSPRNDSRGAVGKLTKKAGVYARRQKKARTKKAQSKKATGKTMQSKRKVANDDREKKRKKGFLRRVADKVSGAVGDRRLRKLAAKLDEAIDDEPSYDIDDLECTDIGEAKVVVYQAIASGYQGHRFVPADVAADRAFGYVRDRKLVEAAIQALLDAGTLARGRDGEYWLAESPTHNSDTAGRTADLNMPAGTKPFKVGRKKARGLKKTIVPRAIDTGNDPGPNRDFKAK